MSTTWPDHETLREARVAATWDYIEDATERTRARLARLEVRRKRVEAERFCEQLVRSGRATIAEARSVYLPLLTRLDDTHAVHRFAEGGGRTVHLTAFELKCRELERLPVVHRYAETQPINGFEEERQVRHYASTISPRLLTAGGYRDAEQFVEKFSEARRRNPKLTASQYLGAACGVA